MRVTGSCDGLDRLREGLATHPELDFVGWSEHVAEVAHRTLFTRDPTTYVGSNIAGKSRTYVAYLGGVVRYRQASDDARRDGYEGFELNLATGSPMARFER